MLSREKDGKSVNGDRDSIARTYTLGRSRKKATWTRGFHAKKKRKKEEDLFPLLGEKTRSSERLKDERRRR